jgi:hypothetical protein
MIRGLIRAWSLKIQVRLDLQCVVCVKMNMRNMVYPVVVLH